MDEIDRDIERAKIGKRSESLPHDISITRKKPIGTNYPAMRAKKEAKSDAFIEMGCSICGKPTDKACGICGKMVCYNHRLPEWHDCKKN